MTWWPILLILLQAASGAVPAWAVLWLVDRLREEPERPIDVEELRAAFEARHRADADDRMIIWNPNLPQYRYVRPPSPGTLTVRGKSFGVVSIEVRFHDDRLLRSWDSSSPTIRSAIGTLEVGICDEIWTLKPDELVDLDIPGVVGRKNFAAAIDSMSFTMGSDYLKLGFRSSGPIHDFPAEPQSYTNHAKARADCHRKLLESGATLDEARKAMGYPPFGDLP